jgi:hypothetical protein
MGSNILAVLSLLAGIAILCSLFRMQGVARLIALVLVLVCAYGFLVLGHLMA